MLYGPNRPPDIRVIIEYDCRCKRASKTFTDLYEARRFFVQKDKEGKRPTVKTQR